MDTSMITPDGDRNRAPALLAIFYLTLSLATVFLALRVYVRLLVRQMGLDDYLMIFAWALNATAIGLATKLVLSGGARHIVYLKPEQLTTCLKYVWLAQPMGILASAFGKCSVAQFILRLLGPTATRRRRILWAASFLTLATSIVSTGLTLGQCQPTRALWDIVPGAKCWNPKVDTDFGVFAGAVHTAMDFLLAFLPVTFVWKLNMNLKKRLGLCVLLGTGVIAGACAAVKTSKLVNLSKRADVTWALYPLFAWTSFETAVVIMSGCVPMIKPIYDFLLHGKPIQPSNSSGNSSNSAYKMQRENFSAPSARNKKSFGFSATTSTVLSGERDHDAFPLQPTSKDRIDAETTYGVGQ